MDRSADLPPYPAYKPSGVEWLGDFPAHWEARRLRKIGSPDSVREGYEISFIRYLYQFRPLRASGEIRADIRTLVRESEGMMGKLFSTEGVIQ